MWPLDAGELVSACGVYCHSTPPSPAPAGSIGDVSEAEHGAFDDVSIGGATGSLRDLEEGDLFVALPFADGDAHDQVERALLAGAAMALVSQQWSGLGALAPQLRARCLVVPDVLRAFREMAAVFRAKLPCPVVAVLGSNGKTTTKEMLSAMLSSPGRLVVATPGTDNGFIGLPRTLCSRVHRRAAPPDTVVLEIGIDTRGAMAQHAALAAPDLAVLTALGPEHLDGLGDTATAIDEELKLFEIAPGARRILLWDDPEVRARSWLVRQSDVVVVGEPSLLAGHSLSLGVSLPFGSSLHAESSSPAQSSLPVAGLTDFPASAMLLYHSQSTGAESDLSVKWYPGGSQDVPAWEGRLRVPMPGQHNARNAALAVASALALGRAPAELLLGWRGFVAPPWRSHLSVLARGAMLYDDCFNASPLSMAAALAALRDPAWADRPKVVVLGDMLDLGAELLQWHLGLAAELESVERLQLFLFGPAMTALGQRLRAEGRSALVRRAQSDGDPVDLVTDLELPAGAIVLVKGSRGTHMERVTRYMESRWGRDADQVSAPVRPPTPPGPVSRAQSPSLAPSPAQSSPAMVVVTGSYGVDLVTALVAAALGPSSPHRVSVFPHPKGLALGPGDEPAVAVFTGLSEADLPSGRDAETHLAEKAQLFVGRRGLRAAVLNADDPASELLAEVIPPGVRILRYGTAGAARGSVDGLVISTRIIGETTRIELAESPLLPPSLDLPAVREGLAQAAAAALLVVLALGGSPRRAAERLETIEQ